MGKTSKNHRRSGKNKSSRRRIRGGSMWDSVTSMFSTKPATGAPVTGTQPGTQPVTPPVTPPITQPGAPAQPGAPVKPFGGKNKKSSRRRNRKH